MAKVCTFKLIRNLSTSSDITATHLIQEWTNIFRKNRIPEPELSAKYLILHFCSNSRRVNKRKFKLSRYDIGKINEFCQQRLRRIPIQYILGEWDFRTTRLKLKPPVLIPRPETEDLVGYVLDHMKKQLVKQNQTFLDIGCGCGTISVSLLKEFDQIQGCAIDISFEAVKLTIDNTVLNGVADRLQVINTSIYHSPLPLPTITQFDHVISNPPYIKSQHIPHLQPEVSRYEDPVALDGGEDGLNMITQILKVSHKFLKPFGYVWLESDLDHDIKALVELNSHWYLQYLQHLPDFTGRKRFHKLQYICKHSKKMISDCASSEQNEQRKHSHVS